MSDRDKENNSFRTLVFAVILVPVIAYLVYFSVKKNSESAARAQQCQEKCTAEGYPGHDFKWAVLSGPVCTCLGTPETH